MFCKTDNILQIILDIQIELRSILQNIVNPT